MPREPRMDCALVLDANGRAVDPRGPPRAEGRARGRGRTPRTAARGSTCTRWRFSASGAEGEFKFMTSEVSREKPIDYAHMARLLVEERERGGYPVWVTGPALVHSRARADMTWFIANGFVGALLAGNAVAVHDIEASIFGTTLGMSGAGRGDVRAATGCTCAPSTRCARRARSRRRWSSGIDHQRHHARVRGAQGAVRAHGLHPRRRAAAGRADATTWPAQDAMRRTRSRRRWRSRRHGAARHRHRQHAARVRDRAGRHARASCPPSAWTRPSSW